MQTNALVIFVKNPLAVRLKTPFAKTVGEKAAFSLYRQLLLHTYNIASRCNADKFIFYSDFINEDDLWSSGAFQKHLQKGANRGERMLNAFDMILEQGYKRVVLIGSETMEIETADLQHAFKFLDDHDVVLGPSGDGYFLLGLKKICEKLFRGKEWNKPVLLQQMLDDISQLHLTSHVLQIVKDAEENDLSPAYHRS